MKSLVLYESQFGNTQKLAELIGKELEARGPVRVTKIAGYEPALLSDVDLVVVGAPTQAHGITATMKEFVASLRSEPAGIPVAVFDTRLNGPFLLWGSAARTLAPKLTAAGFKVIGQPENFTVRSSKPPELETGEEAHAKAWAERIAGLLAARKPVAV